MSRGLLDVVVPAHDEEDSLPLLWEALVPVLDQTGMTWRLIVVDDGSRDGTHDWLVRTSAADHRLSFIRFPRSFGHQTAITGGLDATDADVVVIMDADLQHPPAAIPELLAAWRNGADIVNGVRANAVDLPMFKRFTSKIFYKLLNAMTQVPLPADSPDFRALDRKVVDVLKQSREQGRFVRGLIAWTGYRQAQVTYTQAERQAGVSKFTMAKMVRLAASAIFSFSSKPLRLATMLGASIAGLALIYGCYALFVSLVLGHTVRGWSSLAVLISFLSGIQLLGIGILSEYVGRVFEETKNRPLYVVADAQLHSNGHKRRRHLSRPGGRLASRRGRAYRIG